MDNHVLWEIIGYTGSALVLVSLLMASIVKLRVINAVGSIIFSIYAFKIHSVPTAIMNVCLVAIDLFFLYKLMSYKTAFTYVEARADDPLVEHICTQFSEDISKYFEKTDISAADRVLVVFDKETIAGVTAGVSDGKRLRLIVDYATPQYRDCKVGPYLYGVLAGSYDELVYSGSNPNHIAYCLKVGFTASQGEWVKHLK